MCMRVCVCMHACVCAVWLHVWEGSERMGGESRAQRGRLSPFTGHPRDCLDFTGGTEDKWISQVNKPVLKTF